MVASIKLKGKGFAWDLKLRKWKSPNSKCLVANYLKASADVQKT